MWSWNVRSWLKQIIPFMVNGICTEAFFYSLIKPLEVLYGDLVTYRLKIMDRMAFNGQTIVMEALLNELFDSTLKRIRIITESDAYPDNYTYTKTEALPLYVYTKAEALPIRIFTLAEYISGYEFVVIVPAGILTSAQVIRIKATVNYYRIGGKRPLFKYDNGVIF